MKIAMIGTHGTGKTTAGKRLAQRLGLPFIHERAREVARAWGLTPATIPPHRLVEYQFAILEAQIAAEAAADAWVADRSVIDNMAYMVALAERDPSVGVETVRLYCERAYERLEHYDLLLNVPPMFPLIDDGERHTDPTFQATIQETVDGLVDDLDVLVFPGLASKVYRVTTEGPARGDELMRVVSTELGLGLEGLA